MMKRSVMQKVVLGVAVAWLLGGCVGKEVLPPNSYQLEIPYKQAECKKVRVYHWLGIEVAEKINTRKIAYVESPNKIAYFAKNQWVESLPNMLDSLMVKAAYQNCVSLVKGGDFSKDSLKLSVLELFYDEVSDSVVFEAKLERSKGVEKRAKTLWIYKQKRVSEGDFTEIIKAMNAVVLEGYLEALSKI